MTVGRLQYFWAISIRDWGNTHYRDAGGILPEGCSDRFRDPRTSRTDCGAAVALQAWKRNFLLSILAGTLLYMVLVQMFLYCFRSKMLNLWASFSPWRCFRRPALIDKAKARVSGGNPRIARPQPHCVRRYSGQHSAATPPFIQLCQNEKSIPNLSTF